MNKLILTDRQFHLIHSAVDNYAESLCGDSIAPPKGSWERSQLGVAQRILDKMHKKKNYVNRTKYI
jgi:hypothetical protein